MTSDSDTNPPTQESATHQETVSDDHIRPTIVAESSNPPGASTEPESSTDNTITVNDSSSESAITVEDDAANDNGSAASASSSISVDLSEGSDLTGSVDTDMEYCVQVGEIVEFGVAGRVYDLETGFTVSNLTAYSTLQHANHANVQLISHSDAGISVTVTAEDIVDLTVQYENDINQIFISAINNGGSRPLLLKKRFHYDSCGFALYTSSACDYITSGSDQVSLDVDGTSITTQGCDVLENFDNVPVVEVE